MGPLYINDEALMDIFYQEHGITTTVKKSINKVRGYLEVFTLADIATGDGTKMRPCFSLSLKSDTKSNLYWHEERPSALYISRWKGAISLIFDESKNLHELLGK